MSQNTSHSASTILDDIIDELKLTYDSSVGLLDGEAIREVPSVNILSNLSKLLNNLAKDLAETEQTDSRLISLIKSKISEEEQVIDTKGQTEGVTEIDSDNVAPEEGTGSEEAETAKGKGSRGVKREAEGNDSDDDQVPLKKARTKGKSKNADNADEPAGSNEVGETEEKNEDEDDDDDAPLIKRERPKDADSEEDEPIESAATHTASPATEDSSKEKEALENLDNEDGVVDDVNDKEMDEDTQPEPEPENEDEKEAENERLNSPDDPIPPEQVGHYTSENDTRLKNPKSEFVTSQTISTQAIAELGLFSEDNNGLETQGKEYLKKKYGVASYPENDLKDLLPGDIPNLDFSKHKPPSNQVQFTTFQSYIESFYRLFGNDDLKFLNEKYINAPGFEKQNYDPDVSPYIIPKLGRFYADVWSEEDSNLGNKLNSPAFSQPSLESYKPKGSIDGLNDDKLYTEDISCGPLSNRLLSAILSIHEETTNEEEEDEDDRVDMISDDGSVATQLSKVNSADAYELTAEANDFHSIEERLKRELKYIGIFMNLPNDDDEDKSKLSINGRPIKTESRGGSIVDTDDWIKNKEDDEVSAEIRMLQKDLKESAARNRSNKKKLIPLVEEQIAYQEYCTILEDLDKQVDQAYMKRIKSRGKKKKTEKSEPNPAQQQAMNTSIKSLLDKRKRWIENIGKLFSPPETMKRVPSQSVLEGDLEDDQDDDANEENDVAQDVLDKN